MPKFELVKVHKCLECGALFECPLQGCLQDRLAHCIVCSK